MINLEICFQHQICNFCVPHILRSSYTLIFHRKRHLLPFGINLGLILGENLDTSIMPAGSSSSISMLHIEGLKNGSRKCFSFCTGPIISISWPCFGSQLERRRLALDKALFHKRHFTLLWSLENASSLKYLSLPNELHFQKYILLEIAPKIAKTKTRESGSTRKHSGLRDR